MTCIYSHYIIACVVYDNTLYHIRLHYITLHYITSHHITVYYRGCSARRPGEGGEGAPRDDAGESAETSITAVFGSLDDKQIAAMWP